MRIAVDAMGGDFAPAQIVKGALEAATAFSAEIILVGQPDAIEKALAGASKPDNLTIRPAEDVVAMDDSPVAALRGSRQSSLAVAVEMVRAGEAQAVVSAGNSGAFMAMATMRLRTISGIQRPGIGVFLPTGRGKRLLIDAGANADCKPRHLYEFALMGSTYAQYALGLDNPTVGLLSIGHEESKGNELVRAAYTLLRDGQLNFAGNIEGDRIFAGDVDVVVCDGFVGNVVLKMAEGLAESIVHLLKDGIRESKLAMLGALLMKPALRRLRTRFDYAEYGGMLLLGVNGICVVCHGKSSAKAIRNAIAVAQKAVEGDVVGHMRANCAILGDRPAAEADVSAKETVASAQSTSVEIPSV
jgi:glycerol-3-phosphate acyltransferase PlsX